MDGIGFCMIATDPTGQYARHGTLSAAGGELDALGDDQISKLPLISD